MKKIGVYIRTDASILIGTGHVMRCINLASAIQNRGLSPIFICREHKGHLCDLIEKNGFAVQRLPAHKIESKTTDTLTHCAWLGCKWTEDAKQTSAIIQSSSEKENWLIVDHYALDQRWEQAVGSFAKSIMVIDDLANRSHACDLLVDQNLVFRMQSRYLGKVKNRCVLLLGPRYALLQAIYGELHAEIHPRQNPVQRILIFFGGMGDDDLTMHALNAFQELKRPDIQVDIVLGNNSVLFDKIASMKREFVNIQVYQKLDTLAILIAKADLAIGAAGINTWERICLGLPTVVITLAENQVPIAKKLHREHFIHWAGHKNKVDQNVLVKVFAKILDSNSIQDWSKHCLQICDGQGAQRVSDVLISLSNPGIT